MIRRALTGAATVTLVVLLARSLAYAAEPAPEARFLRHQAGGPAVPLFAVVALGLCALLAITVCWLVAVAVRERALLERRDAQRFAVGRAVALALVLALAASFVGGMLEAYLHWRAGLGWHGLHCLLGPVHRDLLPFEAGLSFVGAAVLAGARHVTAWMRRTFARLAAELPTLSFVEPPRLVPAAAPVVTVRVGAPSARAPPALG